MRKVWEVTVQFITDDELKAEDVQDYIENAISEKTWETNLVFAAEVDSFENEEDSDNRPGQCCLQYRTS